MQINGKTATPEDILPLALSNYGNSTTLLVTDLGVRGLDLHLERLERDARELFGAGVDKEQVRGFIRQIVANVKRPIMVRVTVFCKDFDLLRPARHYKLDTLVTTRLAPAGPLSPVSLKPELFQRDLAELKTVNIGGALYRRRLAQLAGFDDALLVSSTDEISEGPTWNIGFMKNGQVLLPSAPSLPGVSIALLQKALKEQGASVLTQKVRLQDVPTLDAAFIINAGSGVRGVKAIGAHTFRPDDTLNMLRKVYETIPHDPL